MRVGVICSTGGSAFVEVRQACPHLSFRVVTDRPCGVEEQCRRLGVEHTRVEAPTRTAFAQRANEALSLGGRPDFTILFFDRIVVSPLLEQQALVNIHPALLPAFKGMDAVRRALESGVRFFGATLHVAAAEVDAGAIIAQACQPLPPGASLSLLEKLSFIHKVALFLTAIELFELGELQLVSGRMTLARGLPASPHLNPTLRGGRYLDAMRRLQAREGVAFL